MNTLTTHAVIGEDVVLTQTGRRGVVSRLLASIWKRIERLQKIRAQQRTAAILRNLDDRMLKDIGISRSDILSISYGARSKAADK